MNLLLANLVLLIELVDFLVLAVVVLVHQDCLQLTTQDQLLLQLGVNVVDPLSSAIFLHRFVYILSHDEKRTLLWGTKLELAGGDA